MYKVVHNAHPFASVESVAMSPLLFLVFIISFPFPDQTRGLSHFTDLLKELVCGFTDFLLFFCFYFIAFCFDIYFLFFLLCFSSSKSPVMQSHGVLNKQQTSFLVLV